MAKKKPKGNIKIIKCNVPEFKPGNEPHLEYDGIVLNGNVPWSEILQALLDKGITIKNIATYANCSQKVIHNALQKDYVGLCFRSGARILTFHWRAIGSEY